MVTELTELEKARDAVSHAATDWITAVREGDEDKAIQAFDAALNAFESTVRRDVIANQHARRAKAAGSRHGEMCDCRASEGGGDL